MLRPESRMRMLVMGASHAWEVVYSPLLFNHFLYQCRLVDIYLMLWVRIQ